jgi:hypothetical protein
MPRENECEDCGGRIRDEYERCYVCNEAHLNEELTFAVAEIAAESGKAWLCVLKDVTPRTEKWLSKEHASFDEESMRVELPRWLAIKAEIDGLEL